MTLKSHKGWHNRGYLPHYDSPERAQHVIFRVDGPLPKAILACADKQARIQQLDDWLDRGEGGAPLASEHRSMVADALQAFDIERYDLHAWCVMPNHVHTLLTQYDGFPLGGTIRSWKNFSARRINVARGASGRFWAPDYFDRYMRDEADLANTAAYIENNPVVAGLVARPEDWLWSSAVARLESRGV